MAAIHDDEGYRDIRRLLAAQHNRDNLVPDVQVVRFNRDTDRSLVLRHLKSRGRPLAGDDAEQVMKHLARWGFVRLEETEPDGTVSAYREQECRKRRPEPAGRTGTPLVSPFFPDVRLSWQSARIADSHFQQCGVPRTIRTGGRVVEGARLESVYTSKAYRGFESPLSAKNSRKPLISLRNQGLFFAAYKTTIKNLAVGSGTSWISLEN